MIPSPGRRRLLLTTALAAAGLTVGGPLVDASEQGAFGCDDHGPYEMGCRLLAGHPDGWFVPDVEGTDTTTHVPAAVR
jgi:hypothetical protein